MTGWFWERLEQRGTHTALRDGVGRHISFADLAGSADLFAAALGPRRQLVLLEVSNSIGVITALVGCLRGQHPVILAPAGATGRLAEVFRPNIIVSGDQEIGRHSDLPHDLHGDLAVLLSTSGSTGAAKLARLSHRAVHANAASIADYLGLSERDVPITTLPLGYSYGLSVVTSHLLAGANIILTESSVVDADFWTLFDRYGVTSIAGVPYTYELLEASGFRARDLPSLRTLTQAGGRLDGALRMQFRDWSKARGVQFFVMYGQTEATARIAYLPPELHEAYPDCIGRAIPGGRLSLASRASAEEPGELVYEGPNVMMGYAHGPDDLAAGHALSALHTGDLAEEVAPGIFRIVGRLSRFSKIAGLRIGLDDVEHLLQSRQINATVSGDDEVIAVCLDREALRDTASDIIAQHTRIPHRAVVILAPERIPRLSSGKPDHAAIISMAKNIWKTRGQDSPDVASGGLAAVYSRALNRAKVGPEDSFASLGGDSLGYIEVSLGIEKRLGYLPPHWETLCISEIEQRGATTDLQNCALRTVSVETEMLIRPVAMTVIVASHVILTMPALQNAAQMWDGGALVLLMAAGYNICRFQKGLLLSEQRHRVILNFARRVLLPFYLLVLYKCVMWARGEDYVAWSTFLLLDDYVRYPDSESFLIYWFIGVLFQCLVIITVLFSLAPVQRFAERSGFNFGMALLAATVAIKFIVYLCLLPQGALMLPNNQLDSWAYAFALGWAVAEARTEAQRVLCLALGLALAALDWGMAESHMIALGLALLLILFVPRVRLPSAIAAPVALWARATFFIYLSHGFAMAVTRAPRVRDLVGGSDIAVLLLTVGVATAGGIVFYLLWRQGERLFSDTGMAGVLRGRFSRKQRVTA